MTGLILSAALLGVIIATLEEQGFPGWLPMIGCVLAASFGTAGATALLPAGFAWVGLAVGAVCAGLAISFACDMAPIRAALAAAIYFTAQYHDRIRVTFTELKCS